MSRPDHSNRRGSLPTSGVGVCRALPSREESSRSGERPDRGGTNERCRPSAPAVTPRRTAQLLPARSVIDRSSLRLIDGTERALETDWKPVLDSFRHENATPRVVLTGFLPDPPYMLVSSADIKS